jgi:hypothetical protein
MLAPGRVPVNAQDAGGRKMLRKRSFDTLCALSEGCESRISALRARLWHRCPIPAMMATKLARRQVQDKLRRTAVTTGQPAAAVTHQHGRKSAPV